MTPAEHYAEAERILRGVELNVYWKTSHIKLAAAQVHATLALAKDPS